MIPVNEPVIGEAEEKYIIDCVRSGWISSEGEYVGKFESTLAEYVGKRSGIAVCNGTAAVETALYAAGVKEGDEVILPTFTIMSCALAILRLGAKPVLVDIEPDTWNMDVSQVRSSITEKTKAILVVHIYGHPVDMDQILEAVAGKDIKVVEDAAESLGAEYKGKKCGSIGDVSAYSFYANKIVTTGEGGMVLTDNPEIEERARSYRNLCFNSQERFLHNDIGYNFRMSSLQAAVGLGQMQRLEQNVKRKREMGELYVSLLSRIKGLQCQVEKPWAKTVYWMYSVQLDPSLGKTAKEIMSELRERGIGTRPFFRGLHDQPALQQRGVVPVKGVFPAADAAYKFGFYLPSGLTLTDEHITEVCTSLKEILES